MTRQSMDFKIVSICVLINGSTGDRLRSVYTIDLSAHCVLHVDQCAQNKTQPSVYVCGTGQEKYRKEQQLPAYVAEEPR